MKKKKILSFITSVCVAISVTTTPVFAETPQQFVNLSNNRVESVTDFNYTDNNVDGVYVSGNEINKTEIIQLVCGDTYNIMEKYPGYAIVDYSSEKDEMGDSSQNVVVIEDNIIDTKLIAANTGTVSICMENKDNPSDKMYLDITVVPAKITVKCNSGIDNSAYNSAKYDLTTNNDNVTISNIYVNNTVNNYAQTNTWNYTGLYNNTQNNKWEYLKNGLVDHTFSGFAANGNTWMYCKNGYVNTDCNWLFYGTVFNQNGWWKTTNGNVNFNYTGLAQNENGWWYCNHGKVDFDYTGFSNNGDSWWYCKGGHVSFDDNGLYYGTVNEHTGWWKVVNSRVIFDDDVCGNENGWWKIANGMVDFNYNGIAHNSNGWWYIRGGKVDFSYNGRVKADGRTYRVVGGKVNK